MIKKYLEGYPDIYTIQKENELYWLIDELIKNEVKTLLSIGLCDGGSEWHIARIYREKDFDIEITGIDVLRRPGLKKNIQDIISTWKQSFRFIHGSSNSAEVISQLGRYDAVWIDGDHSYEGVKKDFELALNVANKMIAFHDIIDCDYNRIKGTYVSKLWLEIKDSGYHTRELAGTNWGGIGIVYLN